MREIKFRAWDEAHSMMLYGVEHTYDTIIRYTDKNGTEIDQADTGFWRCRSFGEILTAAPEKLMQFTGLHDRNGKEIFEGDVVKWKAPHYVEGLIGQIEYVESLASFVVRSPGSQQLHYEITRSLEVIGNIHENPDLLK